MRLAESVGCSEASRRIGIPESRLFNWIKLKRAGKLAAANGPVSATPRSAKELEAEVNRLQRGLASARLDIDPAHVIGRDFQERLSFHSWGFADTRSRVCGRGIKPAAVAITSAKL